MLPSPSGNKNPRTYLTLPGLKSWQGVTYYPSTLTDKEVFPITNYDCFCTVTTRQNGSVTSRDILITIRASSLNAAEATARKTIKAANRNLTHVSFRKILPRGI